MKPVAVKLLPSNEVSLAVEDLTVLWLSDAATNCTAIHGHKPTMELTLAWPEAAVGAGGGDLHFFQLAMEPITGTPHTGGSTTAPRCYELILT